MSANVPTLPDDTTQLVVHAWSVGCDADFEAGYEVAIINVSPDYARSVLELHAALLASFPAGAVVTVPDNSAHFIDGERPEVFEWTLDHQHVTVLHGADRLSLVEIEPELFAGYPIRLGERFLEINKDSFRYRAERKHDYDGQCVITPDVPLQILGDIVAATPPAVRAA